MFGTRTTGTIALQLQRLIQAGEAPGRGAVNGGHAIKVKRVEKIDIPALLRTR